MSAIRNSTSQHVAEPTTPRRTEAARATRTPTSFVRTARSGASIQGRPPGPRAVAAALFSQCSGRQVALRQQGARRTEFLGHDGEALVFCNREREEVCIQTGTDVCTVKADGRVFLNGDPLERDQPGFLQMRRRLGELGDRVAAGHLPRGRVAGSPAWQVPWDPASPAHANYVL